MSILLDKLLKEADTSTTAQAKDMHWYIAKPIQLKGIAESIKRLNDGIRVVCGKSFAVNYKDDE